jgi:hypothetical protein
MANLPLDERGVSDENLTEILLWKRGDLPL